MIFWRRFCGDRTHHDQEKDRKEIDMRYYETLYIINPNLADEDYRDVVIKFNNLVEKNKGVIIKLDEWGKKTLAYEVRKFDKGFYVLMQYCGEPGIVSELKRHLKLEEKVLKFQTIKLSDDADPEVLKKQTGESEETVVEESATVGESSSEEEGETDKDKEGENGVS